MSFYRTSVLSKLFYPIIILSLLTFSCSTDNSITGNTDQTNLSKPNNIIEIDSNNHPPRWNEYNSSAEKLALSMMLLTTYELEFCFFFTLGYTPWDSKDDKSDDLGKSYDFRDNFLINSDNFPTKETSKKILQ